MCGIVGILAPRESRRSAHTTALLEDMTSAMRARGPDGSGVWVDEQTGIGFGHRRLSVLDLTAHGAQPMESSSGRYVITYNGEIYNHPLLAAELESKGTRLRGHSDTEVLVEAIDSWGIDRTLERIDGMFAFGVWDRDQRVLTLARDRMGEKPLYYGTLGVGEVVFASTLDALRRHPAFDKELDRNALALYFRHKYVPAPWSIFEGIQKLEPGHAVSIGADGVIREPRAYWSFFDVVGRGVTFDGSAQDAVDELERLIRESVRQRLVADVPVGAFLSGGIDSSAVVAVAQQVSSEPVRTFTIGSASADYDESSDARRVANHLGTDHTELMVSDSDALATVERIGAIWDEPFGDSSQVPTILVSELARRDVTVALSGDGGDELFLGYNRYSWVPAIWNRIGTIPVRARRVATRLGARVPNEWWERPAALLPRSRRPRMLGLKMAKVLDIVDSEAPEDVFHRLTSHWKDPERVVYGSTEPPTVHTDPTRWPNTSGIAEHMAAIDAVTYLPDDILTKVDRATMSVSLEGRIPLLSREVVEFAAGLPVQIRLREGTSKWPLRQVLGRSVPSGLFERPKSGFGVPIEDWLRGPLREWAESRLRTPAVDDLLGSALVNEAWRDHQARRRNMAYELWDVLMFASWCAERGVG